VESNNRVPVVIILDKAKSIQVERDGEKKDIPVTEDDISRLLTSQKTFIAPRFPCIIQEVNDTLPAKKAGLQKDDQIIGVNGIATPFFNDFKKNILANKGKNVELKVLRGRDTLALTCGVTRDGIVGFAPYDSLGKFFTLNKVDYSLLSALPAAFREGWEKVVMQVKSFSVIFTVKGAHKSLGGFYSIAKAYDPAWDWQVFWTFTAFLSIVLAFMNLLPIPALDGGHVMFLLYEMVTRRKPNEKAMEYAQYAGMLLLLTLMVYANTDWFRNR
jgi:regulator of sigma E protease